MLVGIQYSLQKYSGAVRDHCEPPDLGGRGIELWSSKGQQTFLTTEPSPPALLDGSFKNRH